MGIGLFWKISIKGFRRRKLILLNYSGKVKSSSFVPHQKTINEKFDLKDFKEFQRSCDTVFRLRKKYSLEVLGKEKRFFHPRLKFCHVIEEGRMLKNVSCGVS